MSKRLLSLTLVMAAALTALPAHADVRSLDGRWKQSALQETFTIQQWLDAGCGPAPQSTTTGGGEIINIRMEGDELAFVGGGRVYRTNQCYDPMPTLTRESHSRASDGKQWRTRCVTPPADPRKTVLNTLVNVASDTHIDLVETGRYEITLENGRCMADVRRTRSFDLVRDENPTPTPTTTPTTAPPKPTVDNPPKPTTTCTNPGAPTKLEVRPSKKLLRTGESFKFRALVLDAQGCETRTPTTWKLAPEGDPKGVAVDSHGNVTIAQDASQGNFEVIATAAGKDARVALEIASPARYDELLARSGLNAAGENDEAATATIASTSIGAGEGRVEDRSRERRFLFLGIIGGVLLVLGLATVILLRRSRRAKELLAQADERHEERVRQALDRRRRREEEHAAQMRAHEESVAASKAYESRPRQQPASPSAPQGGAAGKTLVMQSSPVSPTKAEPMVCPTCHKEASAGTTFCPQDGTALVAASKATLPFVSGPAIAAAARAPQSRGKICPTCGDRFEGAADYCGKDGTQLVLLN